MNVNTIFYTALLITTAGNSMLCSKKHESSQHKRTFLNHKRDSKKKTLEKKYAREFKEENISN